MLNVEFSVSQEGSGQDEQASVQGDDLTMLSDNSFLMCPRITPDCILPMRFLLFQMLGG